MGGLVSIIVPVYNVEAYVDRSIQSLTNQTYRNIEILLVNDGSIDNSSVICDLWAQKDKRIKVIHKKNGGQGSARNKALDIARGEYICFLDSDDTAKKDYIEFLYNMIKEKHLDISACNNEIFDENGTFLRERKTGEGYVELTGTEAIKSLWTDGVINIGPWGKLYKKELWEDIRFKECFSEDWATMHFIYEKADRVGYSYECKIEYLIRSNSSIRKFQEKKLIMLDIAKDNIQYAQSHPELLPASYQKAVSVYFHILFQLPNDSKYDIVRKQIKLLIKEIRLSIIVSRECRSKTKIAVLLSYFGFGFTKKLFYVVKQKDAAF